MILYHWHGSDRNFGDELNRLLWPRLLPDFFDQDGKVRFLGIGSILDGRHDRFATKLVAGSGYGGYEAPIALDKTWIVHWVRGPRTARLLGLPPSVGLGDPGSLVPLAGLNPARQERDFGFMPHFESAGRGAWREVADAAGATLIDPRGDPETVIAAIGKCKVLISEALHGVIVADALRVPWIAIEPLAPVHRAKWLDWAETLELGVVFRQLCPSSLLERLHLSRLAGFHFGRLMLQKEAERLRGIARDRYIEQAILALRVVARSEPQLSQCAILDRGQARMLDAVAALRRAPTLGWENPKTGSIAATSSLLPARGVSDYEGISGGLPQHLTA